MLESFVLSIASFLGYIPNCVSFYSNIICSSKFRTEVIKILSKVNPPVRSIPNQQIVPLRARRIQGDNTGNEQYRTNLKTAASVL
jgi:hypothetical protein